MAHIKVPHTIRRNGIYYFNLRLNSSFIRISLDTYCSSTALTIVSTIKSTSNSLGGFKKMSVEEILNVVERTKKEIIDCATAILNPNSQQAKKVASEHLTYFEEAQSYYTSVMAFAQFDESIKKPIKPKNLRNYKLDQLPSNDEDIDNQVNDILYKEHIEPDPEYGENAVFYDYYQNDLEQLTRLMKSAKNIRALIKDGRDNEALEALQFLTNQEQKHLKNTEQKQNSVEVTLKPFSHYIDEFLVAGLDGKLSYIHGVRRKAWSTGTYQSNFRYLIIAKFYMGDIPLNELTGVNFDDFLRDIVQNMPLLNRNPYRNMTWEERFEAVVNGSVDENDLIKGKTCEEYFKTLMSFFKYAIDEHLLDESPLKEMRLKFRSKPITRGKFSKNQVNDILSYVATETDNNRKWPLILMAYTGMRNGEVMQLRNEDIKECADTNIKYFLITDKAGSAKSEGSVRKIPIHSQIIKLGFLEFVTSKKEKKLFNKDSKFLTSFYSNTLKPKLKLPDETEENKPLSLYSLRHSFITELANNDVNLTTIQQIAGHSKSSDVTTTYYIGNLDLYALSKAVEKVNYAVKVV